MNPKDEMTTIAASIDKRDPDDIRQERDQAVANLTETLDALQEKLQPEALVAEAKEKAIEGAESVRDRILLGARHHPVAAALAALGIAWLVGRTLVGGKAYVGGGIFNFGLGAAVGIGVYRAVITERHLDDEESDSLTGDIEHDVNLPATHPSHVALE